MGATVPGPDADTGLPAVRASTHLPPFCGRLLVKFHRHLHDMSTLCLLKLQWGGRGPDVRSSTVKKGDTHSQWPPALLAPVPAPECRPCTPVPCDLTTCSREIMVSSGGTRLQLLYLSQMCNQPPVFKHESSPHPVLYHSKGAGPFFDYASSWKSFFLTHPREPWMAGAGSFPKGEALRKTPQGLAVLMSPNL